MPFKQLALVAIAGFSLFFSGCSRIEDPWKGVQGQPRVLVTFPPLYSMVRQIAGDEAAVQCLCTTTGPHHYAFNVRDALLLKNADLFFSIGLTLDDHFVSRMLAADSRYQSKHVALGQALVAKNLCRINTGSHDHDEHEEGHDHQHGDMDPHVWLGARQAKAMAQEIAVHLAELTPAKKEQYEANTRAFGERMDALQKRGREELKTKMENRLISFHGALAYMADTFALQIVDTIQINPGAEPDAHRLATLIDKCVKENVRVLAVEPQYPTTSASKLILEELKRKGVNARMVEIDPLETARINELSGSWYEEKMAANLKALMEALP